MNVGSERRRIDAAILLRYGRCCFTLVQNSQAVLEQAQTTEISNRDRKTFMVLLDESDAKPNRALTQAAKRYKKRFK